ncbi:MAG TPA: cyclic nucleotide-binding domain-containing protein [Pyrinomonadaceae bacterium]|nr:cyclic nucleotide-binding domain-containing protein [Pyrinomonadaceae bacterium]
MPLHIKKQEEVLHWMENLDLFSELVAKTSDGSYENELDLDVILYGRGYTGGRVGPYARLLRYEAGEQLVREGEWSMQREYRSTRRDEMQKTGAGEPDESDDDWDGNSFFVLVDGQLRIELDDGSCLEVSERGTTIGAMMLLEGDPADYTASVPPGASASVLEFKRPAIRLLRKYRKFAHAFDEDYRRYGRRCVLRDVEKKKARDAARRNTSSATTSQTQDGHWQVITDNAKFEVFDKNHLLFQAGRPITQVLMVKKGWVEVARNASDRRERADESASRRYLGAGNCFGLEALTTADATWNATATLLARTELLTLPVEELRRKSELAEAVREVFSAFSTADEDELWKPLPEAVSQAQRREITTGIVDGTNLLVMDMDLCVRCGNCSLACHKMHGQSRLLRRGIHIERPKKLSSTSSQHVLSPSVCLHCQDPECLTGCPTGSIGRYPEGQIDINSQTCIGCGDCATQCPYNAISLVTRIDERREADRKQKLEEKKPKREERKRRFWQSLTLSAKVEKFWRRMRAMASVLSRKASIKPEEMKFDPPTSLAGDEPLVAVKCNLCQGTSLNPERPEELRPGHPSKRLRRRRRNVYSCEENCPTGALVRVNPREYFSEVRHVIGTIYVDQTHAIGRNIHRRDTPALLWHAFGILAALAAGGASLWAAARYGLNTPLPGTIWTLRWLTGFVGLAAIVAAVAYLVRKQIYRRRVAPLRYWLLAHVYFSVLGALVLLVHGGRRSGSLVTSALMISFDLVILSGLFGFACYKIAPRILTRIEGQPLLVEDLRARRDELHAELKAFDLSDERLRPLVEEHVRPHFFTMRYLWRQFLRQESLTELQAHAREEFDERATRLKLDRATRAQLIKAVEAAATTRRVEALIYLHRLLRLWVAPHVAFTVLMLVLLVVHIVQVIFFAVY